MSRHSPTPKQGLFLYLFLLKLDEETFTEILKVMNFSNLDNKVDSGDTETANNGKCKDQVAVIDHVPELIKVHH